MFSKFLDPKNNYAFQKIFGTERNKDILIHFLNDMLTFKDKSLIQDVNFIKTVQDPETASQKTSIVDILCVDEKGCRYIVEMQVAKERGFEKRAQYYASKAYISQMHKKGKYEDLKEVIFVAIAEFIMFPKKKAWKSEHVILDKETYEQDLKDFSFTFLELPKFTKSVDALFDVSEKWMYFLKNAEDTSEAELQKLIEKDTILGRAYEELDRFHWNEEELRTYDHAEKQASVYLASIDQKYDEGLQKGEEIGIEKGEKIGIEKGERLNAEKTALKIYELGIGKETISKATGLTPEEIEKLIKPIKENF